MCLCTSAGQWWLWSVNTVSEPNNKRTNERTNDTRRRSTTMILNVKRYHATWRHEYLIGVVRVKNLVYGQQPVDFSNYLYYYELMFRCSCRVCLYTHKCTSNKFYCNIPVSNGTNELLNALYSAPRIRVVCRLFPQSSDICDTCTLFSIKHGTWKWIHHFNKISTFKVVLICRKL